MSGNGVPRIMLRFSLEEWEYLKGLLAATGISEKSSYLSIRKFLLKDMPIDSDAVDRLVCQRCQCEMSVSITGTCGCWCHQMSVLPEDSVPLP